MDYIQKVLENLKVFTGSGSEKEEEQEKEKPEQLLEEVTFEGVANYIKGGCCEYTYRLANVFALRYTHQHFSSHHVDDEKLVCRHDVA